MEKLERKIKKVITYDYWKPKSHSEIVSEEIIQALEDELGIHKHAKQSEIRKEMVVLFNELSPEQQEVLTMMYVEGSSYQAISKKIGKSEVLVSEIRTRATKTLRNGYQDYFKNMKF